MAVENPEVELKHDPTHFAKCSGKQVKQVQAPNLHVMAQGALGKFKNKGTI